MDASGCESLSRTWDDEVDATFFRITAYLFSAEFCLGASAMLAANDDLVAVER